MQEALNKKNAKAKVIELPDSTRTAVDAANALNCDVAQIVKSLIFRITNSKEPVLELASA